MRTDIEQSHSSTPLVENSRNPATPAEIDPCLPDDDSQKSLRGANRPSFTNRLLDGWWTLELVSITIALIVFALYMYLLRSYDGELYDSWDENLLSTPFRNLQSAADFAVTLLRLFMLYPVTAAMGQLKWHYFRRRSSRPVSDLKAFDDASRGISGSLQLIFSRNMLHAISVGCILVIGTLYLGSSTQNTILVKNDSSFKPVSNASIDHPAKALLPFSNRYDEFIHNDQEGKGSYLTANRTMQAAIFNAWSFYENPQYLGGYVANTLPITCSTTACKWDNVTTLAVGKKCQSAEAAVDSKGVGYSTQANITSRFNINAGGEKVTRDAYLRLKASPKVPKDSNFAKFNTRGVIVHVAGLAQIDEKYEAAECILYWQVRTINETAYNSTTRSLNQTVSAKTGLAEIEQDDEGKNITISGAPCNFNDTGTCRYTVAWEAHVGLRNFLARVLHGHAYEDESTSNSVVRSDDITTDLFALSFENSKRETDPLRATLNSYVGNVAIAIGSTIRTVPSSRKLRAGEVLVIAQYYRIDWNFVLYPGIMMVLSMYLFFSTMWRTRKFPTWKSSPLPLLYHGLERPVGEKESLPDLAWMKEASEKHRVVLRNNNDGLGLKLRDA